LRGWMDCQIEEREMLEEKRRMIRERERKGERERLSLESVIKG
jgi:hypothetical protein